MSFNKFENNKYLECIYKKEAIKNLNILKKYYKFNKINSIHDKIYKINQIIKCNVKENNNYLSSDIQCKEDFFIKSNILMIKLIEIDIKCNDSYEELRDLYYHKNIINDLHQNILILFLDYFYFLNKVIFLYDLYDHIHEHRVQLLKDVEILNIL